MTEQRLSELGINMPPAPKPVANYVPAVQADSLVFASGQTPVLDGQQLAAASGPR